MRKAFLGVFAAVLALSMGATSAFAAGPRTGCYYVDANGDGICDNYAAGQAKKIKRGCGRNFIDANGDGICDNYAAGQAKASRRGGGVRGWRGR